MGTGKTLIKLNELTVSQTASETDILAFAENGKLRQCPEGVLIADVKGFIDNNRTG